MSTRSVRDLVAGKLDSRLSGARESRAVDTVPGTFPPAEGD